MTVDLAEIARYMRMGASMPEGELAARVEKLRDEALGIMRTARTWRRFKVSDGAIKSGSVQLEISGTLAQHIAGCQDAFLACGTSDDTSDLFNSQSFCFHEFTSYINR